MQLEIPESYYRNKRATQTYSALLILLAATPTVDGKIKFFQLSIEPAPAMLMIWIAALYFGYGFWLEWHSVTIKNSQAMGSFTDAIEDRITSMVGEIEKKRASVMMATDQLTNTIDNLSKTLTDMDDPAAWVHSKDARSMAMELTDRKLIPIPVKKDSTVDLREVSALLQNWAAGPAAIRVTQAESRIGDAAAKVREAAETLSENIKLSDHFLRELLKNFHRLNDAFGKSQNRLHRVHGGGATALLFAIATASPFTFPTMERWLHDLLVWAPWP